MKLRLAVLLPLCCLAFAPAARAQGKQATVSAALNVSALQPGQDAVVAVVLNIARGYHAQSHTPRDPNLIALTLAATPDDAVKFGDAIYPPGRDEAYPALGVINVYTGKVVCYVPVKIATDAKPGPLTLKGTIRYQICDDNSCFGPETKPWSVETKVAAPGEAVQPNAPELFAGYKPGPPPIPGPVRTTQAPPTGNAAAAPAETVEERAKWGVAFALGTAFLAGILFNVVPCVLPMLPIKVLGFAENAQHDRSRTLLLAGVFGLGIVSVFAVLAVFILVLQKFTWGEQFSNPWFAWGVVILLAVMAAWMFGWLNVNLPGNVYSFSPRHDTYVGNFEWGVLTAILSTPCTGPLFPPLMLWAKEQPVSIGLPAVMMVGVGMAFPYVALSAFPQLARRFPRVGPWADLFKQMMGFMLLGAAVFFAAGRFLHGAALYWALVPVAAVAAVYLMVRTIQFGAGPRGIVIASVLAVLMLAGTTGIAATFVPAVNWQPYSDPLVEQARQKQIVLVKFTANWCLNCQYIERTVFHDKATAAVLDRYGVMTVKADLTDNAAPGWRRLNELSSTGGIPLTAIYVPGRDKPVLIPSVYTSDTLLRTIKQLGTTKTATAQ